MTFPFKYYFHWDDGEVLANGLGPNVTPIAISHVTPVCEENNKSMKTLDALRTLTC